MIDFSDFCTEIFQILRAYGRDLVLYDEQGNRVYEPADARRFYMLGENILLSIHEDGDNSSLKLYLSNSVNLDQANGFIEMLRNIAIKSNLLFHVKKFDKEIKPQDFATRASVNEQENVNMNLMEGLYGTSKSSYLKLESARMIVRHSAKVNENMIGSRGRNIQAIFVENALGERFLFPVNMLSGGRAMTQHVNQGGTFADEVGQQIIRMAQDFRNLARVQQHGKTDAIAQPETFASVQESILEGMKSIKRSFGRVYEAKSYGRETGRLTEAAALMEDSENLQEAVAAWTGILGEGIEQEAVLSLARLVKLPEAQETLDEEIIDEASAEEFTEVAEDEVTDDEGVGSQIDLTVEGTAEQEALECNDNPVIKQFNEWMAGFDPENFLEGKTFKDQKDGADVGRKKKEDKTRRQERDAKRKPVEESAGLVGEPVEVSGRISEPGYYIVDRGDRPVFGPFKSEGEAEQHGDTDGRFRGFNVEYFSDFDISRLYEGKTFKHDDGDDDGSDPKGKKKDAKKKRDEKKEKRERTDEDQSLDLWKNQVKAAHPEVAGKLKFKGRHEDGKTLVSAEIDGEDRTYGVFDMGDEKGEVLENKLKEFDTSTEEPSIHDLKSQLMAAEIKLRSMSPFDPAYQQVLTQKQNAEAKLKGASRYGRPVVENMFPDNDDDYEEDDVSDLIAKYSKDGYEVRRVPQHELNNANMYSTVYRVWDLQANKMLGLVGSEADGWRLIDQHVKETGGSTMESQINEYDLDSDSDDTESEEGGDVHDLKSQLAQTQSELSKMNAFSPMYGQVMRKRDELQGKLKGMSRYGKAVAEDWADGDLMAEDGDAVFTDEEEGMVSESPNKPMIRDDGWFQIDAEVMLDSEEMADYEAELADLGYLVDRDYEWSIAGGDDTPDGIIVRSDAMRNDRKVRGLLGEIHGPGAYANFDDEEGEDEDEDDEFKESHKCDDVIPANQQKDFKKDVQSPNNDDETYVNRMAQLAGLKR